MNKILSKVVVTLALVWACTSANAALINNWTITGTGTTSATQTSYKSWDLAYDAGTSFSGSYTASAVVSAAGDYTFDWDFSGFHSFFRVRAFLNSSLGDVLVNAGPNNCCSGPSNGFSYSDRYVFTNLSANDTISFTFGGSHSDSARALRGTLSLTQVSSPSVVALLSLGLCAVFVRRRKSK